MAPPLKILLTNFRLAERTGSECVTVDLASGLESRGHEVAVYTPEIGPVGEALQADLGIPVIARPEDAPWVPDVIHGQHLLPTTLALLAFPAVPVVYYCHGYGPLEERPPVHPRVRRWLAPSPRFRGWFAREFGIAPEQFVLAPNFVDAEKFRPPGGRVPGRRRALLYHTNLRRGAEFEILQQGCREAGWSFEAVGSAFGGVTGAPERLLPQYELVFTSGRSALEALACGCRVVIVGEGRLSPVLTSETFDAALAVNFASVPEHGELYEAAVAGALHAVASAEPDGANAALIGRVRNEYSLNVALDRMETLYREVVAEPLPASDPGRDHEALHAALKIAASALAENRRETARLKAGWEETKRKREALAGDLKNLKRQQRKTGDKRAQVSVSRSRDLPATAVLECNSDAGRWRLETGGALDAMQDSLVAFGAIGLPVLMVAIVLMIALPDPARSWAAGGIIVLVFFWIWRWFGKARRGSQVLIEADQSQVVVGNSTWSMSGVQEVRASTWMRQGTPGFEVELVVQDSLSPVPLMHGAGHPLPEEVLRRFCTGSGLRLKVEVVS